MNVPSIKFHWIWKGSTSDNQTNWQQLTQLVYSDWVTKVDVQNPLQTDWDSVYVKDIKQSLNNLGTFTWDINSLFNNLDDSIVDNTTANPKYFEFYLERPAATWWIWIVAHTWNFSNVKVLLKDRQWNILSTKDESASNTKYTSRNYPVNAANYCCVRIEFYTSDPVNISFLRIQKYIWVQARLKALKPNWEEVEINATTWWNLKVSIEEMDWNSWLATSWNQDTMIANQETIIEHLPIIDSKLQTENEMTVLLKEILAVLQMPRNADTTNNADRVNVINTVATTVSSIATLTTLSNFNWYQAHQAMVSNEINAWYAWPRSRIT